MFSLIKFKYRSLFSRRRQMKMAASQPSSVISSLPVLFCLGKCPSLQQLLIPFVSLTASAALNFFHSKRSSFALRRPCSWSPEKFCFWTTHFTPGCDVTAEKASSLVNLGLILYFLIWPLHSLAYYFLLSCTLADIGQKTAQNIFGAISKLIFQGNKVYRANDHPNGWCIAIIHVRKQRPKNSSVSFCSLIGDNQFVLASWHIIIWVQWHLSG